MSTPSELTPSRLFPLRNGEAVPLADVPDLALEALCEEVVAAVAAGARLGCWCADGQGRIVAVVVDDAHGLLRVGRALVGDSYPSLTLTCPQAHLFERELAEQYGIVPTGHPWLKPLRYHHRWTPGPDAWGRDQTQPIAPGVTEMFRVQGDEVHEVAVGPVHAGVIEPGHFRFQCSGETVFHLEINLGFQHRGIEQAIVGGPFPRTLHQIETTSGDTTVGHTWAHCLVLEALAGATLTPLAQRLRALTLELERLANHTGDLGALAGDAGFQPTASFNGRIRGDFLNITAALCGSRLGRGMIVPGGVRFDADKVRQKDISQRLELAWLHAKHSIELLFRSTFVLARFEGVGVLRPQDATAAGLVGLPLRACGTSVDARRDHPIGAWHDLQVVPATCGDGDVQSRAWVRWMEMQGSVALVKQLLADPLEGQTRPPLPPLRPDHLAVGLIEGWRGPVLHLGLTGPDGRLTRYKIIDPSFFNWFGVMLAMRDEEISDFPLCNKSFNLSYCGVDL